MLRWLPVFLTAAGCGALGAVAAVVYAEERPSQPISWLDRSIDASAQFVVRYVLGRDQLDTKLRQGINDYLPELDQLPQSRYRLLLVRTLTPLPDLDTNGEVFDFAVMSEWCDRIPNWRDDGLYEPNSDRTVSGNYENFLNWLSVSQYNQHLAVAFQLASQNVQRLTALQAELPNGTRLSYRGRKAKVAQISDDLSKAKVQLAQATTALKGDNESVISAKLQLLDFTNRPVLPDGAGNFQRVRYCKTYPDVRSVLQLGDVGGEVRVASGSTTVTIDKTGSSAGEAVRADVTISGTKLVIVQLDRSSWFNPGLVKMYANGPWREGAKPTFWGVNGDFGLMPDRLVILVEPKVTLKLPSGQLAEQLRRYGADNLSLTFGPHLLRPSQFSAKRLVKTNNEMSIELSSPKATVLAVLARTMPQ